MPSSKTTVVFLGSKPIGYHCLEYLISRQNELNITVIGVLTQSRKEFGGGQGLGELAAAHGIRLIPSLEDLPACDIIYSVQYHQLLRQEHIGRASRIAVNLHMAPLPEYRGCNQFSFAIIDDCKEFGTTIHLLDNRIDHGDVLFERRFPVPPACWVDELYQLTYDASLALFKDSLADIVNGNYTAVSQHQLGRTRKTSIHYRNEIAALREIDLAWPAEQIDRHVRATSMPGFAPPFALLGGRKVYFSANPS